MTAGKFTDSRDGGDLAAALVETDKIRQLAQWLPRPLRFLAVGALGLTTDIGFFTLAASFGTHPILARAFSLGVATLVTWRLNRNLTFDRSGRHQSSEAMRYVAVTATAQATSYAIFAVLVLSVMSSLPRVSLR